MIELKYKITIAGIVVTSIAVPLVKFIYSKYIENRRSVFFDEFDKAFVNLNDQLAIANILNSKGKLSSKRLCYAHEVMFRQAQFRSGSYRESDVEIVMPQKNVEREFIGTTLDLRQISKFTKGSKPLYKKEISVALDKTCRMWNRWVKKKSRLNEKSKIDLVSRFHTYFMIIHPFEDGNGRLGRRLLNEQLTFLFDTHTEFSPDKGEYYSAVNKASEGDESALRKLISSVVSTKEEE
ncbi:TPA: Fic family protein [Vibrio parahaemolyticus]|uniref:Fic family protein n=1 Tax=Vibrio parahaemolyticus TaxID=670 RepID=UPI0004077BA8|nr:Fic family protein [Vibrio parahaemolyticus]EGR3003501.1 hypothetical protein [Vibrio parahaemolyticus]TNY54036.1 hypothetical protein CGK65_20750 [Vibrio parahaemolyticus]TPA90973.1 hypothetical protein DXJ75_25170 [Vibrio parahaemolyticus]HCH4656063.1 Fic family protein [Vibrio parahaemolyticus]HCH6572334.1 Fic family protein [Vibrio parahaemolyticus]